MSPHECLFAGRVVVPRADVANADLRQPFPEALLASIVRAQHRVGLVARLDDAQPNISLKVVVPFDSPRFELLLEQVRHPHRLHGACAKELPVGITC